MDDLDFSDTPSRIQMVRHGEVRGVAPWFGYTVGTLVAVASLLFIFQVIRFEYAMNRAMRTIDETMSTVPKKRP